MGCKRKEEMKNKIETSISDKAVRSALTLSTSTILHFLIFIFLPRGGVCLGNQLAGAVCNRDNVSVSLLLLFTHQSIPPRLDSIRALPDALDC